MADGAHRILDLVLECGGTVTVAQKVASVSFGAHELSVSATDGLSFDQAVANLELALGRRGVDLVRGGRGG